MGAILLPTNPTGSLRCNDPALSFHTAAWGIFEDLTVLLAPTDVRRESILVPFRQGRVPTPMIADEGKVTFKLPIAGDFAPDGTDYADPVAGFVSNLALMRAVTDPTGPTGPVTRSLTYTVPGYGDVTQDVQLILDQTAPLRIGKEMRYGRPAALKRCTLTIFMPNGYFGA